MSSKWRIVLILAVPALILFALIIQLSHLQTVTVNEGRADMSAIDFENGKLAALDGQWEFYWNRLLTPEDFGHGQNLQPDSLMRVPGVWSDKTAYPRQGFATYRLNISYPPTMEDPALRIQNVANAYKLYVNGHLMSEAGSSLKDETSFKSEDKIVIIDIPKDTRSIDLVFQVSNLNCATGGLRAAPVFGSRRVMEQQRQLIIILQMLFIGGVFLFGLHYLVLFILQPQNKASLYFSIFCLISAFRSLGWGEVPLTLLFPQVSLHLRMYLNDFTGYSYTAIVILFVRSINSSEYKKTITYLILLPSLIFDVLLPVIGPDRMTFLTNYLYVFLLLQMLYLLAMQMKAVLRKRENAILMYVAVCVFVWSITEDIVNFLYIGSVYLTCMFLFGNFAFIMAMSYIQAKQQAINYKKLISYNEKLLEADKLKDQIMATEMSFLQAQIKPHFLYNALSAIANVCEMDGKQAGKLIIDLALYLRGSLEFNNLDKMVTIEKELEFVDTYFNIEQARFGQKIQLRKEINIPLEVQIPVLILQPLVENAVRHGISKKPEGGTVVVRMTQGAETVCIEIEDNGVGISGEMLEILLNENNKTQGVGLRNIHNRLLKLYGKGLEIHSETGHTCVRLSIPEGK